MTATKDNPLTADFSESFGYEVEYWPQEHAKPGEEDEEVLGVEFRLYRAYASEHEDKIWECEFNIKWDGCLNLSSNPRFAMHFCSHEGVRSFAAALVKCFELAATLMPTRCDEFLEDGHYDNEEVMAMLTIVPSRAAGESTG